MAKKKYESQISKQVQSFTPDAPSARQSSMGTAGAAPSEQNSASVPDDSAPETDPPAPANRAMAADRTDASIEAALPDTASSPAADLSAPVSSNASSNEAILPGDEASPQAIRQAAFARPAKKPQGRPRKNGEKVRVSLAIPEVLYAKIQEDADKWGGGNVTRTINKVLGERYGVTIY